MGYDYQKILLKSALSKKEEQKPLLVLYYNIGSMSIQKAQEFTDSMYHQLNQSLKNYNSIVLPVTGNQETKVEVFNSDNPSKKIASKTKKIDLNDLNDLDKLDNLINK